MEQVVAFNETLERALADIQSLRQDGEANGNLEIHLYDIDCTERVARAILQAFRRCSINGINFGRLFMCHHNGEHIEIVELELERVLLEANRLSLFTKIDVLLCNEHLLSEHATAALFDGFRMNQRLQSVRFVGNFTRYSSMSLRRLLESNGPLQSLDLTTSRLFEGASMTLAEGLKENTTLQEIKLNFDCRNNSEPDLTNVITALTGHPKLTTIELISSIIDDETSRALGDLLSDSNCKIERLVLYLVKEWKTNGEAIFQGLKQCKTLERIRISGCFDNNTEIDFGEAEMINLMDAVLPNCPRLKSIIIDYNYISSLAKLNTLAPMGQPSKIREFLIDGNPVWKNAKDDDRDALLHFVRSNPELCCLGHGVCQCDFAKSDLYTPLTEHYLDLNQSGRILLSGHISWPIIPLSVWPVVLARVNDLFQENGRRQANVLYHLLGGPAFCARNNDQNFGKRQRRDA